MCQVICDFCEREIRLDDAKRYDHNLEKVYHARCYGERENVGRNEVGVTTKKGGTEVKKTKLRHEVQWFAEQMELTLRKNDHKGGWGSMKNMQLYERLKEESAELEQTLVATDVKRFNQIRFNRVIREATDVANFAMMIADNARRIPKQKVLPKAHESTESTRAEG